MDHLKSYVGENSPQPWVGMDGNLIQELGISIDENLSPNNNEYLEGEPEAELSSPDIEDIIEYEEDMGYSPLVDMHTPIRSPIRTRVGRAIKPRQIYSP